MATLFHQLINLAFIVSVCNIPALLLLNLLCRIFIRLRRKWSARKRARVDRNNKFEWTIEDNDIVVMRLEANKISQEVLKLEHENKVEQARQNAKRGSP